MALEITTSKSSLCMFRVTATALLALLRDLCHNCGIWGLLWHMGAIVAYGGLLWHMGVTVAYGGVTVAYGELLWNVEEGYCGIWGSYCGIWGILWHMGDTVPSPVEIKLGDKGAISACERKSFDIILYNLFQTKEGLFPSIALNTYVLNTNVNIYRTASPLQQLSYFCRAISCIRRQQVQQQATCFYSHNSQQRTDNLNTAKVKLLQTLKYISVAPDSYGSPFGSTYSKKNRLITVTTAVLILMLLSHIRRQKVSTKPGHRHAVQDCNKVRILQLHYSKCHREVSVLNAYGACCLPFFFVFLHKAKCCLTLKIC